MSNASHDVPRSAGSVGEPLRIALVNNMPDAALHATERQFRELLAAASTQQPIALSVFSLPEVPRDAEARAHVAERYGDVSRLWSGEFDALIITGTEPRTPVLRDEPYWGALTRLIDLAERTTVSTVFSCLAAHAAIDYLDNIQRRRLPEKLSGLFECALVDTHEVVADLPPRWRIPHSRLNTIDGDALAARGYRILASSAEAGVDTFSSQRESFFLFLQGHPEYDPGALGREYRRDVGRFLTGQMERYPNAPRDYFDEDTSRALDAFRARALESRASVSIADFPVATTGGRPRHSWSSPAARLYARWIAYVANERRRRSGTPAPASTATALGHR